MTPDATLPFQDPQQMIQLLVGFVIPILVGVLAKFNASAGLKAVLNAGLSAVAAALGILWNADCQCVLWSLFLWNFFLTWITSIVTYYGLWKPTQVAPAVQRATAKFGVGSPPDIELDNGVTDTRTIALAAFIIAVVVLIIVLI